MDKINLVFNANDTLALALIDMIYHRCQGVDLPLSMGLVTRMSSLSFMASSWASGGGAVSSIEGTYRGTL